MSKIQAWITAFRLRTLPLAFSCILMGSFLAGYFIQLDYIILFLCLLTTLFLQVLSNLANDYGDAVSGVDGGNRIGPHRMVSSGQLTKGQMRMAIIICSLLALISGLVLLWIALKDQWVTTLIFLAVGLLSIGAAIKYTIGKNPYGYAGLGDLFVFIFFGIVGVYGSYYLQTSSVNWTILLPSITCGLLSVGVLNVNNMRDIESDRSAGKKSIPVRIGNRNAVYYHASLLIGSLVSLIVFALIHFNGITSFLFLLIVPVIFLHFRSVSMKEGAELDPQLKKLAMSTLLLVLLFGTSLWIDSVF